MAANPRPLNGTNKRQVKRSHSLLVYGRPPIVAKERTSSLKREPLKETSINLTPRSQGIRSPIKMFRGQLSLQRRSKKRSPVVDGYVRSSSPILGFHSPLRGRRGMMHAKSCDITPTRLKLLELEADRESQSSDESWNVNLDQENTSCQIAKLNSSPTSQRRKVWTLECITSYYPTPSDMTDSSTTTSRSHSPATLDTVPSSPGPTTPDLPLHLPDISVSEATPTLTPEQASLRLQIVRHMRACHSTSALYTNPTLVTDHSEPILHELIKTERRYIANLDTLLNTLLPAVEEIVAARDLRLLFPCQLEPLLDWHKQLLAQLEDRLNQNSDSYGIVGDVFMQMCTREAGNSEFFNMYGAYMNEFKVAMQTLAKYEHSSQAFRQEVRSCQQLSECDGLPLSAFLLTPVQRLPRYELLLKDLLKHTPVEHRDNDYLEEAVELLHEELRRLNASIKSCELACSVTRIRNGRRPGSIRRLSSKGRMAGKQIARQLKKHLSTISVEDLSISVNHSRSEVSRTISGHQKVHEIRGRSLYRSEENLPVLESIGEQEKRRPFSTLERTSSCINLAVNYDKHPERKRYSQPVCPLATLESLPGSPEPTSPSALLPQSETDDGAAQTASRASIYSTASSTSGIGSANSQVEIDSTLTLTPSSPHSPLPPPSADSPDITPTNHTIAPTSHTTTHTTVTVATPHRPIIAAPPSGPAASSAHVRWRKRISWAGSFVMPRVIRKKKNSVPDVATTSKRSSRDISLPMDFRHIQHGFIATSTPKSVS